MPPIDRSSFSRLVGGLDGETFERFVADLWAARGWRTSIEDGTVVAERTGSETERRFLVVDPADPRAAAESISAVVVRGQPSASTRRLADEAGASLVGSEELHQLLLYAIPRDAADELCRQYFGRPLTAEDRSIGGGLLGRLRSPSSEVLGLALVVAVLAVGVAGASLAGSSPGPLWGAAEPVGSPTSIPPPTDGPTTVAAIAGTATPAGSGIACAESSTAVFERQLAALAGHRTSDDGHRGVWRRATHEFGWFSTSYVAFNRTMHERPFVHFLHHTNATYQQLHDGEDVARYRLVVTGSDGDRFGYVVTVGAEQRTSGARCWRPTDLAYKPSLTGASTANPTPSPSPPDTTSTGTTGG